MVGLLREGKQLEGDLEEGVAGQVTPLGELGDDPLEGQLGMAERGQGVRAYPAEQFGEGRGTGRGWCAAPPS